MTPEEIAAGIGEAIASKRYNVLVGFILAALIMVADWTNALRFVPPGGKRWVAAILATTIAIAAGLTSGQDLTTIAGAAVTVFLTAVGSYETILKRFDVPPRFPPVPDQPASDPRAAGGSNDDQK